MMTTTAKSRRIFVTKMKFDVNVLERLLLTMKGFFVEDRHKKDVPIILTKEEIDYILEQIEQEREREKNKQVLLNEVDEEFDREFDNQYGLKSPVDVLLEYIRDMDIEKAIEQYRNRYDIELNKTRTKK